MIIRLMSMEPRCSVERFGFLNSHRSMPSSFIPISGEGKTFMSSGLQRKDIMRSVTISVNMVSARKLEESARTL